MAKKLTTNEYMQLFLDAQKLNYDEFKLKYCIDSENYVYYKIDLKVKRRKHIEEGILKIKGYDYLLDKLKNGHYINYDAPNIDKYFTQLGLNQIQFITDDKEFIEKYMIKNGPDRNYLIVSLSKCYPNCKCDKNKVNPYIYNNNNDNDSDTEIE